MSSPTSPEPSSASNSEWSAESSSASSGPSIVEDADARLRPIRLFLLAAGLFVFLTAELYSVGAMPDMAADLGNSESQIGRLVTWYAIGVGVATIPVVIATQRMARRTVVVGSLLTLGVSMGLASIAPNLLVISIARLVGAAAHGAIFAVVPVAAASLGAKGSEGKAVASAFLGASVGVVAGPPFVAAVSQHFGWRAASASIAVLALLIAALSFRQLPAMPATNVKRFTLRIPVHMRAPFFTLCGVTALIVTAHNAAYTFIAPILEHHGISGTGYAVELFAYGLAGALTTAVASQYIDARPARVIFIALTAMVVALLALAFIPGPVAGAVAATAWGGAFGVLPVVMQTSVLAVTPGHNDSSTPIYVVAFQIGISFGAFLGSVLILGMPALRLPVVAAVMTLVAIPLLAAGMRGTRVSAGS